MFCLFCGQRLFYAQSHSDDGHAVTDPAPSDEELNDSHLPQSFVPSTSPSMTEQEAVRHSVQQYPMYSLRLAPQCFAFTSS